jgi:hypothetical protein
VGAAIEDTRLALHQDVVGAVLDRRRSNNFGNRLLHQLGVITLGPGVTRQKRRPAHWLASNQRPGQGSLEKETAPELYFCQPCLPSSIGDIRALPMVVVNNNFCVFKKNLNYNSCNTLLARG